MCGIAGTVGPGDRVPAALDAIAERGPDARGIAEFGPFTLGHVRLSIVDLDSRSDQPMTRGAVTVAYNGELWNFRALRTELETAGATFTTEGDTEVVAVALDAWGPEALSRFDGMWGLAWYDERDDALRLSRDRYGEVPLHWGRTPDGSFTYGSELRALAALGTAPASVRWIEPGTVATIRADRTVAVEAYDVADVTPVDVTLEEASADIVRLLGEGCAQRAAVADVPVAALLSGGIDSAAIVAFLAPLVPDLRCYVAVHDPKALDVRRARETAEFVGVELVEVPVAAPTADDLASTVRTIEMPHKAQVEIAWACLALADRLHDDGVRVVYTGEGSDELWASYGSSFHGVQQYGWHEYRRRLFYGQHRKNFPRCNKVFMRRSIEARLPFLHPPLVRYALHAPEAAIVGRNGAGQLKVPKWALRHGMTGLVPDSVVKRPKVAFQDGAGLKDSAALAVADPRRFYALEFDDAYGGVPA